MSEFIYPALFALFVWWFSTGVIIYLDGLPKHTFKYSVIGATAIMAWSLYGLGETANDTTVKGAYLAFTYGILAWGWQEISFYTGFVTGPRKQPCPEDCRGVKHFWHGVEVGLWHELAIIAAFAVVVWLTWGGANHVGLWTFAVLWWMHQSAKLNVFFGVRNLNEEFLPEHLEYLKRYLTKKSMNLLFPISVTVSTVICAMLFGAAFADGASAFDKAGFTFLGVLMALAILEHWFLVLPIPSGKLWHWGLASRGPTKPFELEVATGFLGSGKTTFLNQRLRQFSSNEKTIALVNDFADLGVDASRLGNGDTDVVELPNGCICCSLKTDLATQISEIASKYQPDRVLIEPSGVADTGSLMEVLHQPAIKALTKATKLFGVIDAGAFVKTYNRMPDYYRAQAALNPTFLINKADLVDDDTVRMIAETLKGMNPKAEICVATHGLADAEATAAVLGRAPQRRFEAVDAMAASAAGHAHGHHHENSHEHSHDNAHDHDHDCEAHGCNHDHAATDPVHKLGLTSYSAKLSGPCEAKPLRELLTRIAEGAFGEVDRVKGIARSGGGWIQFDVAGGHASISAFAAKGEEQPRVIAIGKSINGPALEAAFGACH